MNEGSQLAITERNNRLDKYTEDDVNLALRLLVLVGGDVRKAVEGMADEGIIVDFETLRYWRDNSFPRRYADIRAELMQDTNEKVAGDAMDRAQKIGEATDAYIEKATEMVDAVAESKPDRLASNARDLARAQAESVNTAQLLRNRPTQIIETRDTNELIEQLARMGIVERDPREQAIETTALEVQSAAPPKPDRRRRIEPRTPEDDRIAEEMAKQA